MLAKFIGRLRRQISTQVLDHVAILRRRYGLPNNNYTKFAYIVVIVNMLKSRVKDHMDIEKEDVYRFHPRR
jgi:hypothetical protein